ncbi:hypothetical protein [Pseudogemmobacter sp. W21_MBD1_M6]|uniref:hypothetical protein n=1 Tax=Pseudogemmobacter sp. W21_MBD1_M6 TaxID=3240271 RepID=UPI003F950958
MNLRKQSKVTYAIWFTLCATALVALVLGRLPLVFVSLATLGLSMTPALFAERFAIRLPISFVAAIVVFAFATLFLGEAFDFYNRYWWWDIALHGGSAVGFGLLGFLFIFILFEGDKYAAPPWAIAALSWCVAMTIGAIWEIFEFTMDQTFGMNMQKSGLIDTMWDLIVDGIGGGVGALAGFFYLKGQQIGGLSGAIDEFIRLNRRLFNKTRK